MGIPNTTRPPIPMAPIERTTTPRPEPTASRGRSPALTERRRGEPPITPTPEPPRGAPRPPPRMAAEARRRLTTRTPEPPPPPVKAPARRRSGGVPSCRREARAPIRSIIRPHRGPWGPCRHRGAARWPARRRLTGARPSARQKAATCMPVMTETFTGTRDRGGSPTTTEAGIR